MSRSVKLVAIALGVTVAASGVWLAGQAMPSPLIQFVGLMIGGTTFVALPADTFVLSASRELDPVTIGVVGGAINTVMVLVERKWILLLVDCPTFERFVTFFDTNRVVSLTNRNQFLALLIGGASFIPYEPFRLVAVMRGYSPTRYALATFIARGGRYYILAVAGTALFNMGILRPAIWVSLTLFAFGVWRTGVSILNGSRKVEPGEVA
ncbi:MAG: hypothetical protein GY724_21435 [Actinomycetia bacterium]|nr:hypothetical protein [Actinomycetes bacterium]MCP4224083.1 hypothetical protein [Actinomycetes bacterium]